MGTIGSRKLFELLLLAKQAVFETATSPVRTGALSLVEVTRTFTTQEILCWEQSAGAFISAQPVRPAFCLPKELQPSPQRNFLQRELFGPRNALPLSYSDFRR